MKRTLVVLGLAGMLVLPGAARAGGGGCHNESQTEATGTTVRYQSFCPTPTTLHVKVGQTVTWTNDDQLDHTVTSGFGYWAGETLAPQQSFSHRFDEAGSYTYYCMLHPGMAGTVIVGDTTSRPVAAEKRITTDASTNGGFIALAGVLGLVVGVTGTGLLGRRSRVNGNSGQQA